MSAIKLGISLVAWLGIGLSAQADTVSLIFDSTQPLSIKTTTSGTDNYETGVLNYTSSTGASFAAFCIELSEDYATTDKGYQTYEIGTFTGRQASALQGLYSTTWSSVDTALQRAAFQTAVWEITHETSSAAFSVTKGAGSFYFDSVTGGSAAQTASFVSLVNSYLHSAEAYTGPALYQLTRLSNSKYQDLVVAQIAPVPEPSRLVLMAAGLGAVGFVAARRRRVD